MSDPKRNEGKRSPEHKERRRQLAAERHVDMRLKDPQVVDFYRKLISEHRDEIIRRSVAIERLEELIDVEIHGGKIG